MSNENFFLDPAGMTATLRSMNGIHQSLESGLSSIVADIEALLADGWSGTAAERFRSHYQAVRSEAERVLADGREIVAHVPQVVNLLTDTDNATSATIQGASSSLDLPM
ncbi:WXG100 family type VII secretion target [Nocardia amikacinitolerans]|uniref:WXG100 family type VII secretion target n=1 Tax=Nocardia amikacinitolerans TaxID=756689 RepID=UPI0020A32F6A|nr:WXG100 family type VII secretion target [Nocardia amikacinitolerans]MCP2290041.1 WXG100 family type VII secretion target [Nocardia amikacinitolerans]